MSKEFLLGDLVLQDGQTLTYLSRAANVNHRIFAHPVDEESDKTVKLDNGAVFAISTMKSSYKPRRLHTKTPMGAAFMRKLRDLAKAKVAGVEKIYRWEILELYSGSEGSVTESEEEQGNSTNYYTPSGFRAINSFPPPGLTPTISESVVISVAETEWRKPEKVEKTPEISCAETDRVESDMRVWKRYNVARGPRSCRQQ